MEIFGVEIKNKKKEREKMAKYKKERYKVFTFAVPESEYELYKAFFSKSGGFTHWVKEKAKNEGIEAEIRLFKSCLVVKEHSKKEYDELEGSLSDGL